jgi:hypothetical protein
MPAVTVAATGAPVGSVSLSFSLHAVSAIAAAAIVKSVTLIVSIFLKLISVAFRSVIANRLR